MLKEDDKTGLSCLEPDEMAQEDGGKEKLNEFTPGQSKETQECKLETYRGSEWGLRYTHPSQGPYIDVGSKITSVRCFQEPSYRSGKENGVCFQMNAALIQGC